MPTSPANLNLELNVQDIYGSSAAAAEGPITPETWEGWFQSWFNLLVSDLPEAATYELSLRLTDDKEIQSLNAQYRQQEKPTDVLAFAALETDCPHSPEMLSFLPLYLGDIVISVETAIRQAQQQQHSLTLELIWLASHGLLHLLGWDHPDEESLIRMLKQQQTLLQVIGFAAVNLNLDSRPMGGNVNES